ncbi:hypothetical protein P3X46_029655 [Hevea brasiliensis]|uniref:RALF n=1 Tax=Hevea brasiliensis TaxID=3981 RepID=A0ABQ9KUM4_HEVBR|nr:hypothetical protein P3X46_029655 [Hevea brasiliensis]
MATASKKGRVTLCLAILLVVFCSTGISTSRAALLDAVRNISCNGRERIADESIKEKEIQTLLVGDPRYYSYRALRPQPFCNERLYGNCLRALSSSKSRCTYYIRCRS